MIGSAAMVASVLPAVANEDAGAENWVSPGKLFVGVNYQPVDRSPAEVALDIGYMKEAGLQVVRIGDLSWDSFEPRNGEFTFAFFDSVVEQLHEAGIQVVLDVGGSIAPIWLHHEYPGVTLVSEEGDQQYPERRYMLDISDPDYRRLLHRFADKFLQHYGNHPAFIAIGYNNEMGNGYMSYSELTRQRFIEWLKNKYGSLESLNKAWATQRWSRQLSEWDQIRLPGKSSPSERSLDKRRFWSDSAIDLLRDLDSIRQKHAPDKPTLSNLWPDGPRLGFDWQNSYRDYATHGAFGYYAEDPLEGSFYTMLMRAGMTSPVWFNEFQAGREGFYGEKGRSPMLAYLGLLNGGQGFLAWTFNSHLGGEEQILFGLLDHDNTPSWKLKEWGELAKSFQTMQKYGFPRELNPEVAISYSWDSLIAAGDVRRYYKASYMKQRHDAFEPLYADNIDTAVISLSYEDLSGYKLIVVPGEYLLDEVSAKALRDYVEAGGAVVMTALSAKVNETNQWHNTSLPGKLADVFGVKTHAFSTHAEALKGAIAGVDFETTNHFYEVLEPGAAGVLARFDNLPDAPPAVTINEYGSGKAIYVATQSQVSVLEPLYRYLYEEIGIKRGPVTPKGVQARDVDGRILYVNTKKDAVEIEIDGIKNGLISGKSWTGKLRLEVNGVDLLE